MLSTLSLSFTHQANASKVLSPSQQTQVAKTLEHSAEVMSNTALQEQLSRERPAVQDEILKINTHARHIALQVALLVPLLAGLLGLLNSFRMIKAPDPVAHEGREAIDF
jgi:hypothetical protein